MFEVVTAVAWEEWEGIVMVTMVLVGAWVWDTEPKEKEKKTYKIFLRSPITPVYLYPNKEGKNPDPDNLPEEPSNFSPEVCSCTSKCSLYHK